MPPPDKGFPSRKVLAAFIRRSACHCVALADLSIDAMRAALRTLADDVRTRLAELLHQDVLELGFQVGSKFIGEQAFFARLGPEHVALVPELRGLLTAYLDYDDVCRPERRIGGALWGPQEDGAALVSAMAALLRLDPASRDIFRVFLRKRDEHELHAVGPVMQDYIAAVGWPDAAAIRFGIYFTLVRHTDGYHGDGMWNEHGVLDAAAAMLDAETFAGLVVDEIEGYAMPGTQNVDELYKSLNAELATRGRGGATLAAAVARLRPQT
jgi:hypothetical protein